MTDDSNLRSSTYLKVRRKSIILFIGFVALSGILGPIWGQAMTPIERQIPMEQARIDSIRIPNMMAKTPITVTPVGLLF